MLAAVYLLVDPPSADLAAQTYRTGLFERAGFVVFDLGWYGGHHNPAYSILFPPLAAWFGPRLVGAAAAVAAAWAFERIVGRRSTAARVAALWFATATMVSLVTGRLTFALGLALALLAVLALARERLVWCGVAGAAGGAGLAGGGRVPGAAAGGVGDHHAPLGRRRRAAGGVDRARGGAVAAVPRGRLVPVHRSARSGRRSRARCWSSAVLWRSAPPVLRLGLVFYVLLLIVSGAISSPMGGNAVRLGAILAGPLAALLLWDDRRRLLALVALPFLYWQVSAPIDDVWRAARDPSVHASYYDGLLRYLHDRERAEGPFRIEIPFTDNHWESARVAPTVPLARGWERQLDRKVNALFYDDGALTPAALPRVAGRQRGALRRAGRRAGRLLGGRGGGARARRAARSCARSGTTTHWRVFAVRGATPLADGGARVTRMAPDAVDLTVPRAGAYVVRVRFTPYWRTSRAARASAPADPGDDASWTRVTTRAAGPVRAAGLVLRSLASARPLTRCVRLAPVRCGHPHCVLRLGTGRVGRSMPVGLTRLMGRVFPNGPFDVLRQVALFAAAYYGYRLTRGAIDDPQGADHGVPARAPPRLASSRPRACSSSRPCRRGPAAGRSRPTSPRWIYINAQTSICLAALIYIYLFHNERFYFVRNMFMVAMAIALVGYVLYPTAPPRFFPEWGFHDTVCNFVGVDHNDVKVNALFNPYAAVPSMHCCFALMIGWSLAQHGQEPRRSRSCGRSTRDPGLVRRRDGQPLDARRRPRRGDRGAELLRCQVARAEAP